MDVFDKECTLTKVDLGFGVVFRVHDVGERFHLIGIGNHRQDTIVTGTVEAVVVAVGNERNDHNHDGALRGSARIGNLRAVVTVVEAALTVGVRNLGGGVADMRVLVLLVASVVTAAAAEKSARKTKQKSESSFQLVFRNFLDVGEFHSRRRFAAGYRQTNGRQSNDQNRLQTADPWMRNKNFIWLSYRSGFLTEKYLAMVVVILSYTAVQRTSSRLQLGSQDLFILRAEPRCSISESTKDLLFLIFLMITRELQ